MTRHCVVSLFLTLTWLASASVCAVETNSSLLFGNTFAVSNGFTAGNHPAGSHFHSSNLAELPSDNPQINFAGVAEVGGFFGEEEVRGISEFDVQDVVSSAELLFEVFDLFEAGQILDEDGVSGLYDQGRLQGVVDLVAYVSDGTESLTDYEIAPISETPIFSVDVTPLVVGGDEFSVDVTGLYNDLAERGEDLGIRFQLREPSTEAGAITFTNIRLQLQTVPEPSGFALLMLGMLLFLRVRK